MLKNFWKPEQNTGISWLRITCPLRCSKDVHFLGKTISFKKEFIMIRSLQREKLRLKPIVNGFHCVICLIQLYLMLVQLIDFPNKDQIASNNKKQNELFFSLHVYVFLIDFLKD